MRRFLRENIGWKLLSLAIAAVLWYAVVGSRGMWRAYPPRSNSATFREIWRSAPRNPIRSAWRWRVRRVNWISRIWQE